MNYVLLKPLFYKYHFNTRFFLNFPSLLLKNFFKKRGTDCYPKKITATNSDSCHLKLKKVEQNNKIQNIKLQVKQLRTFRAFGILLIIQAVNTRPHPRPNAEK